ncbi:hypothetical protein ACVWZZ_005861 [Bradyrhizobium sp. LM6.10]
MPSPHAFDRVVPLMRKIIVRRNWESTIVLKLAIPAISNDAASGKQTSD